MAYASSNDTISLQAPAPAGPYPVSGQLVINKNLTIVGAGARASTIEEQPGISDRVLEVDSPASVRISGVTVSGGDLTDDSGFGGGGIYTGPGAALTLDRVTVAGNTSIASTAHFGTPGEGGGIENDGTLTLIASTVSANLATFGNGITSAIGGGISDRGPSLTAVNSTISGNAADGGGTQFSIGGGLAVVGGAGNVVLANVTLASNSAIRGGADAVGNLAVERGTVTVGNTLIALGAGSAGLENCERKGTVTSNGYNLEDRNQCGFVGPGDRVNVYPVLGALQNNGGPTDTQALLARSPAIDAGNPAGCTDPTNGNAPLTVDQRGVARPQNGRCDIGAYEAAPGGAGGQLPAPRPTGQLPGAQLPGGGNSLITIADLHADPVAFAAASSGASIAARRKRKTGTTISYVANQAATTKFTVLRPQLGMKQRRRCVKPRNGRRGKRCTRYVAVGSFTRAGAAGANSFRFSGRVGGRALRRGSYRLDATSYAGGNSGTTASIKFRIIG